MSATNRGAERVELDGYFTDPELAHALIVRLVDDGFVEVGGPGAAGPRVLEPHCGMGAFAVAARKLLVPGELVVNDIDRKAARRTARLCKADGATNADFLEFTADHQFDLVIGNPPFGRDTGRISKRTGKPIIEPVAHLHVLQGLEQLARGGCLGFLLRLAMLESLERFEFWQEHKPAKIYVLVPRPSFVGGQTDNCAYGFFVWTRGLRVAATVTEILKWREKKPRPVGKRRRAA